MKSCAVSVKYFVKYKVSNRAIINVADFNCSD